MKLNFAFVTLGLPFNGGSLGEQVLGGSESAFIYITKELAKRGHSVHAFTQTQTQGSFDGVHYFNFEQFKEMVAAGSYDVVISSRWPEFLTIPSDCGMRVLWCHDTLVDINRFMGRGYQTDLVMLLSKFHFDNYAEKVPELDRFSWITRNGVDKDTIEMWRSDNKDPNKIMYTSRPERGLVNLLRDVFPKILEKRPETKLYYCYYRMDGLNIPDHVKWCAEASERMAEQYRGAVVNLGNLTKDKLYSHMSEASLMVYPTAFAEISCISAIEAQALGTPFITTNGFALTETVGPRDMLVDGNPDTNETYSERFAEKVVGLLNNPGELERLAALGQSHVAQQKYYWKDIAAEWEKKFISFLEDRWKSKTEKIILELARNDDLMVASKLLEDEKVAKNVNSDLKECISWSTKALQEIQKPVFKTPEDVKVHFEQGMSRWQSAVNLLQSSDRAPKKILDACCGHASFGIFFAKALPTCHVDFLDKDENVLAQVKTTAEKVKAEHVGFFDLDLLEDDLSSLGKYEVVFLGNIIDEVPDPTTILKKASELVAPEGVLLLTTRYGSCSVIDPYNPAAEGTSARLEFGLSPNDKLWNFSLQDLTRIFLGTEDQETSRLFSAVFAPPPPTEPNSNGHWVTMVAPRRDGKYGTVDFKKKALKARPYQSVAVCMIAKSEEENIAKCLRSVRKWVDKIVVADSTPPPGTLGHDRTAEIVERFGGEVRPIEFDYFAQARNESIKDIDADWILWLDADERLHGGEHLRRYLNTVIFNGFSIRQVHLTLDHLNGSFDTPIRIFRNESRFKFIGAIHEHAEDVSKDGYDNGIQPALLIEEMNLAHFGYLDESIRRDKCSNRNMELLRRDFKEFPGRRLTQVLAIRDYLNIIKWKFSASNSLVIRPGTEEHELCLAAIDTFLEKLSDPKSKYHALAWPMYQEAVGLLGRSNIPYRDEKKPPIELTLLMAGAVGGESKKDQNQRWEPKKVWFLNEKQMLDFVQKKTAELIVATGLGKEEDYKNLLATHDGSGIYTQAPDATQLLEVGSNVVPKVL